MSYRILRNKSIGNKDVQCKTDFPFLVPTVDRLTKCAFNLHINIRIHQHYQEGEGLKCKRKAD